MNETINQLMKACKHELHGYAETQRWSTKEREAVSAVLTLCESHVAGRNVMTSDELEALISIYRRMPPYWQVEI